MDRHRYARQKKPVLPAAPVESRKLVSQNNMQNRACTRLVIVDPHVSGHHSAYIRRIVEGAIARGMECLVITSEAPAENPEFSKLKNLAGARLEWAVEKLQLPDSSSTASVYLLYRQFVFWQYFRRATNLLLNPAKDHVLVPYLDDCSYAVALLGSPFGSTPWAGISMRAIFHFPDVGINGVPSAMSPGMQKYFFERLARNPYLVRLFFIDETILDCPTMGAELREKSRYLPDPSEPPTRLPMNIAREQLGLKQQDKI